jgi:hypothetical protein
MQVRLRKWVSEEAQQKHNLIMFMPKENLIGSDAGILIAMKTLMPVDSDSVQPAWGCKEMLALTKYSKASLIIPLRFQAIQFMLAEMAR